MKECEFTSGTSIDYRLLGENQPVQLLTNDELQTYIDERSKEDGLRGRKVAPATIDRDAADGMAYPNVHD